MAKNIIKLNRGDSYEFKVSIPAMEATDFVYFALLYPHQRFEEAIFINGYDLSDCVDDEILIKIEPNDTKDLAPGIYYYTVKLQRGGTFGVIDNYNGITEVRTIIERTKFIIND